MGQPSQLSPGGATPRTPRCPGLRARWQKAPFYRARTPGRRRVAAAWRPRHGPRIPGARSVSGIGRWAGERAAYDAGMRFAIAIPQDCADGSFSPEGFRSYFARAEELGVFHSAW